MEIDFDHTCGLKTTKAKLTSCDTNILRFDSASIGREVQPNDAPESSLTAILTLKITFSTLYFAWGSGHT